MAQIHPNAMADGVPKGIEKWMSFADVLEKELIQAKIR